MAWAQVERRPRGEDGNVCSTTIVAEIISCMTTRNARTLKSNPILLREIESPAPSPIQMGHQDGTLGPLDRREGGNRAMP